MTKIDSFITAKIRDFFEYTIAGEWGSEGNSEIDTPVLRSTNFTNKGKIDYSDLAYRKIDSSYLSRRLVNKETILIEKSGGSPSQPAGRVVYCEEDFIGSASNFIEIAKINNLYCAKYIFFLLHYLYQTGLVLKYQQQTTGIINFKLEQYKEEEVLFASDKKEQEKIAEVLSTIDLAIAQTEAIIAKQQRIKTGLIQDLLTKGIDENGNIRSEATHEFKDSAIGRIPVEWNVETIGKIASLQRGHDIREVEFIAGEYPVIASSGVIGFHNISTSDSPNVVVGRKGSIGNVYYLDVDFWAHDTSLYVTNFFGNNEKYIYYLFSYLELERFGTKSGSPSLNRNDIHPLKISLPKPSEQKIISKILTQFDDSISNLKSGLDKLQHQKTGLMQDLLTGKVRVTNLLNQKAAAN
ncbi:hypothetical protein BMF77_pc00004 (plasmid) [Dolichospermum sp. UHCC 0315A]|uniref:restriction endonuclease subunit S n=1 Tax=Dolichospermum sp. UHCC 0315A TaxID=1914871 RepID=UPI0011E7F035|nr:restriction endonuclease subunit S [Dolichospermum sp. UHCC 0315A]MDM3860382.1 restriction endonuclease subunit S [Aphanizomenon gracile PMC644.10]QEI44165.1 hypothetical protein BMF77_04796 [Dolichospermum sp. UHCC 0315A]QEI44435.1 hypothetical protein BMF77_pc00004 [Dolichospermum sp. UHCC 0315A]